MNEGALGATFGRTIEQVLEILFADGEDVAFGGRCDVFGVRGASKKANPPRGADLGRVLG